MRRLLPLTVLLFAALAGPASADLTLTEGSGGVTVTGTNARETLDITGDGSSVTFAVPSGTIAASGCSGSGASVTCTTSAATVSLGGGDDTLRSPSPLTTTFTVRVSGQDGTDTLNLAQRAAGVTATLSAVTGSALRLQTMEDLVGTPHADTLAGNNFANTVRGGGGDDRIQGGRGDDRLEGDSGADALRDSGGTDVFLGEAGNDRLFARDELGEPVGCGEGRDTAVVDAADVPAACETVEVGSIYAVPTPTPSPTATPVAAGTLKLRRKGAKLRGRTIRTRGTATCGATPCRLRVAAKLGRRTRTVAAGAKTRVRLRLSRKAVRRLRRGRTRARRLTLRVRLSAPGATTVAGRVRVTVRA